ncbi:Hypothetical_protein [Hexamita inflata]|uniref:Hypothetical_protein n=1 Tax=Hexamita inflata TaxID=28002 RepID=A0AA86VAF2_9EUKA|nr:Hypothetical protein HINF_LOCUS48723 [Hexamita inflata]
MMLASTIAVWNREKGYVSGNIKQSHTSKRISCDRILQILQLAVSRLTVNIIFPIKKALRHLYITLKLLTFWLSMLFSTWNCMLMTFSKKYDRYVYIILALMYFI